jgi:hypothetical protein
MSNEKCPLKQIRERSGKLLDKWALKVDSALTATKNVMFINA